MKIPPILLRDDLRKILSFFGQRVITLYLALFLLGGMVVNYRQGSHHAHAAAVSRLMPGSFNYLFEVEGAAPQNIDRAKLAGYERYFERLLENYPSVSDARGLLGFCYYYLGKERKALEAYRTAAMSMPQFFSFQYNLGVIYFKKGRYQEAAKSLTAALTTDMFKNIDMTVSSRAFLPLLRSFSEEELPPYIQARLKSNYRQGFILLIVSYYHLKKFPEMLYCAHKAIESDLEEDGIFYYYAGYASQEMKDYKQALALLATSVQKDPENVDVYQQTALCLRALGKEDLAAPVFEHAKSLMNLKNLVKPFDPEIKIVAF